MSTDISALSSSAIMIRDESVDKANTAQRVGSLFVSIVDQLQQLYAALDATKASLATLKARVDSLASGGSSGGSSGASSGGITNTSTQLAITQLQAAVNRLNGLLKMA